MLNKLHKFLGIKIPGQDQRKLVIKELLDGIDSSTVPLRCDIDDNMSEYFMFYLCKYISLQCAQCETEVGKIIISTPPNLLPLLG